MEFYICYCSLLHVTVLNKSCDKLEADCKYLRLRLTIAPSSATVPRDVSSAEKSKFTPDVSYGLLGFAGFFLVSFGKFRDFI